MNGWGIYDTQDKLWMGNARGPLHYDDREMARMVCQVVSDMTLGTDLDPRFQVRELPRAGFQLRDEVRTKRTAEESLQRIEGGAG